MERQNRNIKTLICSFVEKHADWDKFIPELAFALRTAVNESTKFTPARLNFGRELRIPADWAWQRPLPVADSHQSYADKIRDRMLDAISIARENSEESKQKQKRQYDQGHTDFSFKQGDLVLRKTHSLSNAALKITSSLCPKYDGPYVILRKISKLSYELGNMDSGKKCGVAHISHLKEFHSRADPEEPNQNKLVPATAPLLNEPAWKAPHRYNLRSRKSALPPPPSRVGGSQHGKK